MKFTRRNLGAAFVAVLAVLALAAIAGYPLIPAEALAGFGMVPLAVSGELTIADIGQMVDAQGKGWAEWQKKSERDLATLSDQVVDLAKKANRPVNPNAAGGGADDMKSGETWFDTKTRNPVSVLSHRQSLAKKTGDAPSVGRMLRGMVMGGRADDAKALDEERKALGISSDPSGGFTVAGMLAEEWIDRLRAKMVLSRAGARTVPMDTGTLSIARVLTDPTVSWHGENAAIAEAAATFGQVNLNAKTAVCLVKMSLELSQDSANIEQILESTITSAMSGAIDGAGLNGVTVDAGAAPSGIVNLDGRNRVLAIGAPSHWDFVVDGMYELMVDNVPLEAIGAMVAHPKLWKTMNKLKDAQALPLPAQPDVVALPKLWTTAAPLSGNTATAVIADWRDLLFGVRKNINVRVLQESFLGSNLQIAVLAYARVDFAATRADSFCTLEGITTA